MSVSSRGSLSAVSALALGMPAAAPASAQVQDWSVQITPYLWAAGISGDLRGPRGAGGEFDASFEDVLENLDLGLMVLGEARGDRFGLVFDTSYTSISTSGETPGIAFSSVDLDQEMFIATVAGAFRVVDGDWVGVDVLGGARVFWTETTLALLPGQLPGEGFENEQTWVDPVVGARAITALSERWTVHGYADVGGFGVSSDLTWQAYGGLSYAFNDAIAVQLGYRYLVEDFEDDGFVQDLALHGPLIGASFRR